MSEGDDFQWLYTRRVKAQPGQGPTTPPPPAAPKAAPDAAEHTQVLPTVPAAERTIVRPVATHVPNNPPFIAPMPKGAIPGSERPKIKRPIKTVILAIVVIIAVWIVGIVVAGLDVWGSKGHAAWVPGGNRPADQPGTTFLMVGSDSRYGLTPAEIAKYSPGSNPNDKSARTDTIMLVHTGSNGTVVMSIPRDSIVEVPGCPGVGATTTKINAAFSWCGPKGLVRTIEHDTGIRIDGYVEIGFAGLAKMVDAVGGIQVCPTEDIAPDPTDGPQGGSGFKGMTKGCHPVDGATALAYARNRHTVALGDMGRAAHQREVIAAVMHKLRSMSIVLNPFRLDNTGRKVVSTIQIGDGMSLWQAYDLFDALKALSSGKALSCGTPISDQAVHWSSERAPQMFDLIKTDQVNKISTVKNLCTSSGLTQ